MKRNLFIFLFIISSVKFLVALPAKEILKKVDRNMYYKSLKYEGKMIIKKSRRRERIKTFKAITSGNDKAFIEFTNPGDRGTKYLKLGKELWVKGAYAERADKISGHFFRDSMMGSDFSYEDTMKNEKLIDKYNVKIIGDEKIRGKECYKLLLIAKVKKISYPKQILWVDKEIFIPVKIRLFALSGILLKELTILSVKKINGKFIPIKLKMEDKQHRNSYTILELNKVEIDKHIKNSVFSKRNLER